jgi:primase-polymerase (primpol)-like protein
MAAPTPNTEREALIERLAANMPQAMRERAQWLLWKLEEVEGRKGLQKVPYYGDGGKRFGDLGSPKDRKRLLGLDAVLQRFRRMPAMTGVGFAFLDGDGLVGIDLDWKTEPGGLPLHHHEAVMDACDSYTEFSPSGKGVHIITQGSTDSFKHDAIGVEVHDGSF